MALAERKARTVSWELPGPLRHLGMADLAWNPDAWWEVHPDWLFRRSSISFLFLNIKHMFLGLPRWHLPMQETQVQSWVW